MGRHRIPTNRIASGLLLGAAASGALALASLSAAGPANATCASIDGVSAGSSGGSTCTSGPDSVAIGVGNNTKSTANGTDNTAIAIGDQSQALVNDLNPAVDNRAGDGSGNLAIAMGFDAAAVTRGTGNLAVAVGNPANNPGLPLFGQNNAGVPPTHRTFAEASGTFNRAFSLGDGSLALANGGNRLGPPATIGNNTAISSGTGAISYAGAMPIVAGGTTPNNQFAFAGPGKIAMNTVVP